MIYHGNLYLDINVHHDKDLSDEISHNVDFIIANVMECVRQYNYIKCKMSKNLLGKYGTVVLFIKQTVL